MTVISTNPESRVEKFVEALVARLREINPVNTPLGAAYAYGTTVREVSRRFADINSLTRDNCPKLFIGVANQREQQRPGRRCRITLDIAIAGGVYAPNESDTERDKIESRLQDFYTDVRRAILSDGTIGDQSIFIQFKETQFDEGIFFPAGLFVASLEAVLDIQAGDPASTGW